MPRQLLYLLLLPSGREPARPAAPFQLRPAPEARLAWTDCIGLAEAVDPDAFFATLEADYPTRYLLWVKGEPKDVSAALAPTLAHVLSRTRKAWINDVFSSTLLSPDAALAIAAADDPLAHVEAYRLEDAAVTRGLVKFGLPELFLHGVTPETERGAVALLRHTADACLHAGNPESRLKVGKVKGELGDPIASGADDPFDQADYVRDTPLELTGLRPVRWRNPAGDDVTKALLPLVESAGEDAPAQAIWALIEGYDAP